MGMRTGSGTPMTSRQLSSAPSPPHIAKYPWEQQQYILHRRWLGCGLPPKPGNDIVIHNITSVRGDPERRWPIDITKLKKEVVQQSYDKHTWEFAKAQNIERQRAHIQSPEMLAKMPHHPDDDIPRSVKVPPDGAKEEINQGH